MSIARKLHDWSISDKGKAVLQEAATNNGMSIPARRTNIMTKERALEAGQRFTEILLEVAQENNVPEDVLITIASLTAEYTGTKATGAYEYKKQDTIEIRLSFELDLLRDSLMREKYGTIDNIVALFNNGYHARNYVYGPWYFSSYSSKEKTKEMRSKRLAGYNSHNRLIPAGHADYSQYSAFTKNKYIWIRSKKDREPLNFIQEAVSRYKSLYRDEYNIIDVIPSSVYGEINL